MGTDNVWTCFDSILKIKRAPGGCNRCVMTVDRHHHVEGGNGNNLPGSNWTTVDQSHNYGDRNDGIHEFEFMVTLYFTILGISCERAGPAGITGIITLTND